MITLRDAIVHSGRDMRRPMNLLNRMKTINADQDVNRALMTMLSLEEEGEEEEVGRKGGKGGGGHQTRTRTSTTLS